MNKQNQKGEIDLSLILLFTLLAMLVVGISVDVKREIAKDNVVKGCISSCETDVCIEKCKNIPRKDLNKLIDEYED